MTDMVMDEMHLIVREAMGTCLGHSVKAQLLHAARELRIEFRRVRGIYYREARAILAYEADTLRRWYCQHCDAEASRLELRLAELRGRHATLRERRHAEGLVDRLAHADVDQRQDGGCGGVGA